MMSKVIYCFSIVFGVLSSCSTSKSNSENVSSKEKAISKVVYHYQDASVPPEYHRSLTYDIKPGELNFLVDSYGDTIKNIRVIIDNQKWKEISQAIESCGISKSSKKGNSTGCSGGTSNYIHVYYRDNSSWHASRDNCGGEHEGDFEGDIPCLTKSIRNHLDAKIFEYE
jgi:hypothetical protein